MAEKSHVTESNTDTRTQEVASTTEDIEACLPKPAVSAPPWTSVYDIPIVENAFSWAVATAAILINMLAISIVYSWGECSYNCLTNQHQLIKMMDRWI